MSDELLIKKYNRMKDVSSQWRFDLRTDVVTLPPNWTLCTNYAAAEGCTTDWLRLIKGRVVCYTDAGPINLAHVHSVQDIAYDAPSQVRFFIDNYELLPDYVVTGHFPFDHSPTFLTQLAAFVKAPPKGLVTLHEWCPAITLDGYLVKSIEKINDNSVRVFTMPEFGQRAVKTVWSSLFSSEIPQIQPTSMGFMTVIPKRLILCRTKEFWKNIYNALKHSGYEYIIDKSLLKKQHHDMAFLPIYAFEAIWPALFNEEMIPWPQVSYRAS